MEAEQEKWLNERLKEGIEVQELFPHKFLKGFVYYDIIIHGKRTGVVVEVKRENLNHSDMKPMKMQITKVFEIVRGEKEAVKYSNLINRYVTFLPEISKFKGESRNPFELNGKFFLQ